MVIRRQFQNPRIFVVPMPVPLYQDKSSAGAI